LDDKRRLRLVEYVTYMREIRNVQQNFDQTTERKRSLGRTEIMLK
jgi:hypothetical protein